MHNGRLSIDAPLVPPSPQAAAMTTKAQRVPRNDLGSKQFAATTVRNVKRQATHIICRSIMGPLDSGKSSRKNRDSHESIDWGHLDSPRKICQEGDAVWAEVDFDGDAFSKDTREKKINPQRKSRGDVAEEVSPNSKRIGLKQIRSSKHDSKKKQGSNFSREGEQEKPKMLSLMSPELKAKSKMKKSSSDKLVIEGSPTKEERRSKTKGLSTRSRSPTGSVISRRREKVIDNMIGCDSPGKKSKSRKNVDSCDGYVASSVASSRRRVVPIVDLASSRTRAVQRSEARNNWRETHSGSKDSKKSSSEPATNADDALDMKAETFSKVDRRMSLLEQSRTGPVRASSVRMLRRSGDDDDDDDDDDFSVISAASASFMVDSGLDAPFTNRRPSCAGGYLPSDLSATPSQTPRGRRASALGSSLDRAQLIFTLKKGCDDEDDDDSCSGRSAYALPNDIAGATSSQFDIGRSNSNVRSRRPSMSSALTIPCVNGSNSDLSTSDHSRHGKSDRKSKSKSNAESPPNSKSLRKKSENGQGVLPSDMEDKKGACYDSAVDDMLKSRRLRGARGDAPVKKVEKEKPVAGSRRMSLTMLSNMVSGNKNNTGDSSSTNNKTNTKSSSGDNANSTSSTNRSSDARAKTSEGSIRRPGRVS